MTEVSINDLDPRLKKQIDNAEKSLNQNAAYTVEICTGILARNPGCLELRQILRKAQKRASGAKAGGFTKFLGSVTNAPFAMKAGGQVKKDPQAALESAEKLLTANPNNAAAHRVLGQAAEALELWNTAAFAYECLHEIDPKDQASTVSMGNALIEAGRPRDAIRVCDQILQDDPGNEAAQDIIRRASVAETMEKGKWEDDAGFRDKLADEEKSIELEQQARSVNDEETLQTLLDKNLAALEEEPTNLNIFRDIISNYRALGDLENAIGYVGKAREIPEGKSDPTLERLAIDLKVQSMTKDLETKRAQLEAEPDNATLKTEIETLEKEEFVFRLENAKSLVEKYPNDYAARFELGKLLYMDGQYDPSIQQFQLAQRNPKVRVNAILFLGRAYLAKKFSDLAVEQLDTAKKELSIMNDLKKEVIYELATAYEQMGQESKAIDEYKIIYASDIGYRDVSDKINAFYEKQQQA